MWRVSCQVLRKKIFRFAFDMDAILLKHQYINACNAYLEAFCDKHGFDYDEAVNSWVAGEAGGVCSLGDYFVSFEDMRTDIDRDAVKSAYWKYHDYFMEAHDFGFNCPNYKSWLRGCPRLSEGQIKSLREAKNRVYEAQKEFELDLKKNQAG